MDNPTKIHQLRQGQLTREMLSGVRDAAMIFLLVYDWDRCNTPVPPQRSVLNTLEGLRRELNNLHEVLQRGAA